MIRIISGKYKSRQINTPTGDKTRPTTSRVREAIFSALDNAYLNATGTEGFSGARVWDTFAGSGALGLEALSRGAEKCIFTDVGHSAIKCIQQNIELLKISKTDAILHKCSCLKEEVCRSVFEEINPNIVLIDAPYSFEPAKVYCIIEKIQNLRKENQYNIDKKLLIYYEHSKNIEETPWQNLDIAYSKQFGYIKSDIFVV